MIGDLKIPVVTVDGEQRLLPEAFDVLVRFSEHRQLCEQCDKFFKKESPVPYCLTGMALHDELLAIPGVEYINVREKP